MEIVLITGMSGSGKSVALRALEDSGFYCVDNLPPELLIPFAELENGQKEERVAIAIDVRSASSLPLMPGQLQVLESLGFKITPIFLDASSDTLLRRYSESRRRHPLSGRNATEGELALTESIEYERELLSRLREKSHIIDTSFCERHNCKATSNHWSTQLGPSSPWCSNHLALSEAFPSMPTTCLMYACYPTLTTKMRFGPNGQR